MISRLVEKFYEIGFELTAKEISEILWLASHFEKNNGQGSGSNGQGSGNNNNGQGSKTGSETSASSDKNGGSNEQDRNQNKLSNKDEYRADIYSSGIGEKSGYPFRVPAAFALPGKLEMGRAIRPLMQKRPSLYLKSLDESRTIRQISESQNWVPFFTPVLTRWLDLVLVIDESSSMVIWKKTLSELQLFFERHGAFRNVQTWGFSFVKNRIHLHQGYGNSIYESRVSRNPLELVDPGKQRLFLMVTDCVSPRWYDQRNNQIIKMLKIWGHNNIVAIVHMLPYRLWSRSALGNAVPVYLRSARPGNINTNLEARMIASIFEEKIPTGLKMPVISLEADSLKPWAKSVAGIKGRWIRGVVFPYKAVETDIRPKRKPTADERIKLFNSTASPMARRLAGYLSAAPLTLPVMRLVQRVIPIPY